MVCCELRCHNDFDLGKVKVMEYLIREKGALLFETVREMLKQQEISAEQRLQCLKKSLMKLNTLENNSLVMKLEDCLEDQSSTVSDPTENNTKEVTFEIPVIEKLQNESQFHNE